MPFYFAYGADMHQSYLQDYDIFPTAREPAMLQGYQLVFNRKPSLLSTVSIANIKKTGHRVNVVEGILYTISDEELKRLASYQHNAKQEILTIGLQQAHVLVAEKTISGELPPAYAYVEHMVLGAEQGAISKAYINSILLPIEVEEGGTVASRRKAAAPTPAVIPVSKDLPQLLRAAEDLTPRVVEHLCETQSFTKDELNQALDKAKNMRDQYLRPEQKTDKVKIVDILNKGADRLNSHKRGAPEEKPAPLHQREKSARIPAADAAKPAAKSAACKLAGRCSM